MWTNHLVTTETKIITHPAQNVKLISDFDAYFQLELADSAMSDFPEFREFILTEDNRHFAKATAVQYEISTGILGYDVVKSIEFFD